MNENDYEFVGEPTIQKNGDKNPIVSYWVEYRIESTTND